MCDDPRQPMNGYSNTRRRKLKALIITMPGSDRKSAIEDLFAQDSMREHFEPPAFSDGVPSRSLGNRFQFFTVAHEAGLIPELEWEALQRGHKNPEYQAHSERFFDCLNDVPVQPGRRGSESDVKLHYSVELWRKAKTINRGRAVLGCTFAHLIALKRYLAEGFDMILEDNVRAPTEDCAHRVWQSMEAMREWEQQQQGQQNNTPLVDTPNNRKCHLRFLGWLGSVPNIQWILERHTLKRAFRRDHNPQQRNSYDDSSSMGYTVVPFPKTQDILEDLKETEALEGYTETIKDNYKEVNESKNEAGAKTGHTMPGGNPVWGSYAYWISEEGYKALLTRLQNDVGAMLWKGKRMRYYIVKPADKVLPRLLMDHFGQEAIQLSTYPAFFRAPMLTSKIHTKWDPEFCKSTEFQLAHAGGLTWSDLWLTEDERAIIAYREEHGEWITQGRVLEMRAESEPCK